MGRCDCPDRRLRETGECHCTGCSRQQRGMWTLRITVTDLGAEGATA